MTSARPPLPASDRSAVAAIRYDAHPVTGDLDDYDALADWIGDARVVLLGEATHGTHELYRERARITRRLIERHGFNAVAIEGDWPDAHRVNRYVKGGPDDRDAEESLRGFRRFPTWMWRNAEVVDFVGWLRSHNDRVSPDGRTAGFYGLDLYSLAASMDAVVSYLDRVDPPAAARARRRYACLQPFAHPDAGAYGEAVMLGVSESCHRAVLEQLVDLRRQALAYLSHDGVAAEDESFHAERNAVVVANAEEYYRTMLGPQAMSWNLRDRHMADTLEHLLIHLDAVDEPAKVVVWAHNSHVGDARHTDLAAGAEISLGQLTRERHGRKAVLVGFTIFEGTVTAASEWGAPAERMCVQPALAGSLEALLHEAGHPAFLLCPFMGTRSGLALRTSRLERAIGVVYRPHTERQSHYLRASAARQFDAIVHVDVTRAVEPLERTVEWESGEPPETFPTAW